MSFNGNASLEEASAFQDTWNKMEESHSYHRTYKAGICRLRFSFFANDFDLRSRAVPQSFGLLALREGAAQAATAKPPLGIGGLARLRLVGAV
jgi:hypothetical protein